jgi:hypothetical protein
MLHPVALVITDVSVERVASIIRVTRIGDIETTLAVYIVFLRSLRELLLLLTL